MILSKWARWIFPSVVGLLLGALQTGLFFHLDFMLSSAFETFLLVTLSWLLGSGIGLFAASYVHLPLEAFLALTLAAYFGCVGLVGASPFDSRFWLLYAALIMLAGLYPGVFFARMTPRYPASVLLFRENNGFILGLAGTTLLYILFGRSALWLLPLVLALSVLLLNRAHQ